MKGTSVVPSGMPGGIMTISSNGSKDGIVWAMHNARDNSDGEAIVEGIVRAFDATDVTRELWADASIGLYAKFCPPVVANGRLCVATCRDLLGFSPGLRPGCHGLTHVYLYLNGPARATVRMQKCGVYTSARGPERHPSEV